MLTSLLGVHVWPGILSGLEICTGIVACCTITYRPLVEKLFTSPVTQGYSSSTSNNQRQGWTKIHVQNDVSVTKDSHGFQAQSRNGLDDFGNFELGQVKSEERRE
jgi:hypothetical protein